jgi:hypothetical protein
MGSVLDEEWRKHQRDRAQQLDQHVQRRARGIFEWITNGVSHHSGFVSF